jgi:hypothetical protein
MLFIFDQIQHLLNVRNLQDGESGEAYTLAGGIVIVHRSAIHGQYIFRSIR